MKPLEAALSAFYPVIVLLGALIWMRFFPLLRSVEANTKPLICSMLMIVTAVMVEQLIYGFGRLVGIYINIAMSPGLVAVGKILYCVGFSYMLYAFWLLSPVKPRLWVSVMFTAVMWGTLFLILLV